MKTARFKETVKIGRLLRKAGKQFSIDRGLDHFRGALFCVHQFGLCAGLTMSVLMWMSVLLHAAHSGAEKGVL